MARLTFEDVRSGRAIPQRGDTVGQYVYTGGDPSDLSRYQPLDGGRTDSSPLTGSIYDSGNITPAPNVAARGAASSMPAVSGVKMLMPDIPGTGPLYQPQGNTPMLPAPGLSAPSAGAAAFQTAQDDAANPQNYPVADVQTPASNSLIGSQCMQTIDNRLQTSLLNNTAQQLGQMPVPLIDGRKVPGGRYNVRNVDKFDTDPSLAPDVADAMTGAINDMNAQGIIPTITKGFRSAEEQKWQRENPGSNGVAAGLSWHQAGHAVDLNHKNIDKETYASIVSMMKNHGFTWGGDKFNDPVHFYYAPKGTTLNPALVHQFGGD